MYGTPNYVLEIIIRIIWWRRMNVYMFRRVLSIEAIKRVNNLLIQYVIVLVPVEFCNLLFWKICLILLQFPDRSYFWKRCISKAIR